MSRALRTLLGVQLLLLIVGVVAVVPAASAIHVDVLRAAGSSGVTAPKTPAQAGLPARRAPQHHLVAHGKSRRHHARHAGHRSVHHLTARTTSVARRTGAPHAALSAQQRMEQAVARIPGYPAGGARWFLVAKDGFWGTADWYHDAIYISPSVPANRIYDVVAHEWAHLLSAKAYGDVRVATEHMNAYFGGSGVAGAERAADCMARQLGAVWTHYTPCLDARWQHGAAELLAGRVV